MSVKVVGPGMPLVVRAVLAMSRDQVLIGIPADSPPRSEPGAPPNAVIGYVMETGAPDLNIPARPTLVPGMRDAQPVAVDVMRQAAIAAVKDVAALKTTASNGGAVRQGLEAVGAVGRDAVQARYDKGPFVPLKPSTIKARRERGNTSTAPLKDTLQLRSSVTYRIRPKAGR